MPLPFLVAARLDATAFARPITPLLSMSCRPVFQTAAVLCVVVSGCAQRFVELRERRYDPVADRIKLYAFGGPRATERTQQVIRKYGLDRDWSDESKAITGLARAYASEPNLEVCYALAELNYIAGSKGELFDQDKAFSHFLTANAYAHAYLFSPEHEDARNIYDPWFREASEIYNSSLESGLRIGQRLGQFKPDHNVVVNTSAGPIEFRITTDRMKWNAERIDEFKFVSDYRVVGLNNVHQRKGLGVPLIAIQHRKDSPKDTYYPEGFSFPVTAFLRWDYNADGNTVTRCTVELYDPLETSMTRVGKHEVALESDSSTPLAYFLNNAELETVKHLGFFLPHKAERVSGLYMVQPYDRDKIPVVMVHGLWSSPMTWMEALNDLMADAEIRDRFQFWFYLYPSGEPFLKTAADLRADLNEVQSTFGSSESLENMVVVGHSMGGLIARLLTIDSGDRFIASVSDNPARIRREPTFQQVSHHYVFSSQPHVRRVVTIGTPYRGSKFANPFSQFALRRLANLPKDTIHDAARVVAKSSGWFVPPRTSLDSLSADSSVLRVVATSPASDDVHYHNVAGVIDRQWIKEKTDGVVTLASARREDVESELVVDAHHGSVHRHPLTILELRRILLEHATEFDSTKTSRNPIRLLGHEAEASEPTAADWTAPIPSSRPVIARQ